MMFLKIKIFVVLAIILAIGLAAYKLGLFESMSGYWQMPEHSLVMSELVKMREINRLYTGSYMVPVMDVSYGVLKRDLINDTILGDIIGSEPSKTVPKGYCLKKFDVGFGYDNVLAMLQDETFMGRVCSGQASDLPVPALLSVNSKSTEINGDYQGTCRDLDQNPHFRRAVIYRELGQGEAFKKINEQGQKSLHALASLLCR
jgi:hypothetical protein